MNKKELAKKNLESLIAHEIMLYTQETGEVVDDIYISPYEDKDNGEVYYDIDLELLWLITFIH